MHRIISSQDLFDAILLCLYSFFLPSNTSEGQDEYEKDGFIVDDIEEEEEQDEEERAESDEERQKKKKRKKKLILYPSCFFSPLLVVEVDELICSETKAECLIICK